MKKQCELIDSFPKSYSDIKIISMLNGTFENDPFYLIKAAVFDEERVLLKM